MFPPVSLRLAPLVFLASGALACGPSFYRAAPPLRVDGMTLAVKSLAELYDLAQPPAHSEVEKAAQKGVMLREAAEALKLPVGEGRAKLDALVARGHAESAPSAVLNLLWDFRDLLDSTPEPSPGRDGYVSWRLEQVRPNAIRTLQRPTALSHRWIPDDQVAARNKARQEREAEADLEVRKIAEAGGGAASPALVPHWRMHQGAALFRAELFDRAASEFDGIVRDFPDHPRAETAAFMAMRCRIELARNAVGEWQQRDVSPVSDPAVQAAWNSLNGFAGRFAEGRFKADLPGWEGALHQISGSWPQAFQCYIRQAEHWEQPAVVKSALHEAERCLRLACEYSERSDRFGDRANYDIASSLADYPRAAVRFVYFMLEPSATTDFDQWPWSSEGRDAVDREDFQRGARWRIRAAFAELLPDLAMVLEKKGGQAAGGWDPFALAVVGWAACEEGEFERTLTLCRNHPDLLKTSDDLQMVRAIALQRMGRAGEAVSAWQSLVEAFPASPLCAQATQRLTACLKESGDPAAALVTILKAQEQEQAEQERENAAYAEYHPRDVEHPLFYTGENLGQWADVLELAAPLDSLDAAFRNQPDGPVKKRLSQVLTCRLLARGDFESAAKLMREGNPTVPVPQLSAFSWFDGGSGYAMPDGLPRHVPQDAAIWASDFEPVAAALRKARAASSDAALLWLEAGEAVARLRDRWSLRTTRGGGLNSEGRKAESRLRRNARTLGYSAEAITGELLGQDFLYLASDCWQHAANGEGGNAGVAARALLLENEALRRRAELTSFAAKSADDQNWTERSGVLVGKIRKLAETDPTLGKLAAAAVPWQFRDFPWLRGNTHQSYADDVLREVFQPAPAETDTPDNLSAIPHSAHGAFGEGGRKAALEALSKLRLQAGSLFDLNGFYQTAALRLIGDLDAACRVPDLSQEQWEACLKFSETAGAADADTTGWEDLADYNRVRAQCADLPRYSPEISARWQLWMARHPGSVRAEAAAFQYTRAECRRYRGWTRLSNTPWPDGPLTNSYYLTINVDRAAPADPAAVKATLDAFDQHWPNSHFAADMALLRAGAAIDREEWGTALDEVLPVLRDPTHRELHMDAASLLADLFLHLLEPEARPGIAAAIRTRPQAREALTKFTQSNTPGSRLLPFRDWLGVPDM